MQTQPKKREEHAKFLPKTRERKKQAYKNISWE
jgi:hypothetical protein